MAKHEWVPFPLYRAEGVIWCEQCTVIKNADNAERECKGRVKLRKFEKPLGQAGGGAAKGAEE